MITADTFLDAARVAGIDFYTGVPCSYLTPLINRVVGAGDYVGAASEGEAVAIAAGAWLGGRGTAVICQNSGLGNAVNPLTSLNAPFRIPTLLIPTWRGRPGEPDEPQHELMGRITHGLLELMEIPHAAFPDTEAAIAPALARARATLDTGRAFALVMAQGSVRDDGLATRDVTPAPRGTFTDLRRNGQRPSRARLLEALLACVPADAAIIATTGKAGRELFTLADRPQHLYQVGSMGCAAGMGLGVALTTQRRTIVLDGDGAALMKLGTQATIGACAPASLLHILLDNGVHDSTGGQPTVSPHVDFAGVALACGYRHAIAADDLAGFEHGLARLLDTPGPSLLHARISPGSMAKLGRPTVAPHEVAQRFRAFLAS